MYDEYMIVIPTSWYKKIKKDTGKPHFLAIVLLADIVACFNTNINIDKTNKLQRSSNYFAEKYNVSKRSVTEALRALENIGAIKRSFKTVTVDDINIGNIQYIEACKQIIQQLSFDVDKS